MADGYLGKCKECAKSDTKNHREENIDRVREYDRNRPNAKERNEKFKKAHAERMKDPEYREKVNRQHKDWAERNTVKRAAHIITGNAIRDGKLVKQPCEVCGELKAEAHHDDYEKPLDVRWLCRRHHAEHHKKLRQKERLSRNRRIGESDGRL
jgi:hypothetical protein